MLVGLGVKCIGMVTVSLLRVGGRFLPMLGNCLIRISPPTFEHVQLFVSLYLSTFIVSLCETSALQPLVVNQKVLFQVC